jgi:hypothetical protein
MSGLMGIAYRVELGDQLTVERVRVKPVQQRHQYQSRHKQREGVVQGQSDLMVECQRFMAGDSQYRRASR